MKAQIGLDGTIRRADAGGSGEDQKPPVAWAVIGTLDPGRSVNITMQIRLAPEEGKDGETNYYVNLFSSGDTEITTETPTVRRTLEGLTWLDNDRDGIQDSGEERISGVKVELLKLDENGEYKPVCYAGTTTPVVLETGRQVSLLAEEPTGEDKPGRPYEVGRYRFTDLGAGTFAVRFSDGTRTISGLRATPENRGSDDTLDSDAEPFYEKNVLSCTLIADIRMPRAEELPAETTYESKYHDSGFYHDTLLAVHKTDESGNKSLYGAEFSISDQNKNPLPFRSEEDGTYVYSAVDTDETTKTLTVSHDGWLNVRDLLPGIYFITETKAPEGFSRMEEPAEFELKPDGSIVLVNTHELAGVEDDGRLKIRNVCCYELPETGGPGTIPFTFGGILLMAAPPVYVFFFKKRRERRSRS